MPDVFLKGTASAKGSVKHGTAPTWDLQMETAKVLAPIVKPVEVLLVALHTAQTTVRQQRELIDQLRMELEAARSRDGA